MEAKELAVRGETSPAPHCDGIEGVNKVQLWTIK